jgi:hypothetical protein
MPGLEGSVCRWCGEAVEVCGVARRLRRRHNNATVAENMQMHPTIPRNVEPRADSLLQGPTCYRAVAGGGRDRLKSSHC